jgi:hypothetical protein
LESGSQLQRFLAMAGTTAAIRSLIHGAFAAEHLPSLGVEAGTHTPETTVNDEQPHL